MRRSTIKIYWLFIIISTCLVAAVCSFLSLRHYQKKDTARQLHPTDYITVGDKTFHVQVARTPKERALGLSGIPQIQNNEGMLFVFDPPEKPAFWMKNMRFPIDIVWIRDQTVISISANVPVPPAKTDAHLPLYQPNELINEVIELAAGATARHHIQPGDTIIQTAQ